jgi:hypothetical protein
MLIVDNDLTIIETALKFQRFRAAFILILLQKEFSAVAVFFVNLYQHSAQLSGTEDKPCCMMMWKKCTLII